MLLTGARKQKTLDFYKNPRFLITENGWRKEMNNKNVNRRIGWRNRQE